jgi:hypothetical protein
VEDSNGLHFLIAHEKNLGEKRRYFYIPRSQFLEQVDSRSKPSSGMEIFKKPSSKVVGDIIGYLNDGIRPKLPAYILSAHALHSRILIYLGRTVALLLVKTDARFL